MEHRGWELHRFSFLVSPVGPSPWHTQHRTHTHTRVFLKSSRHMSLLFGFQTQAICVLPDWFVDLN